MRCDLCSVSRHTPACLLQTSSAKSEMWTTRGHRRTSDPLRSTQSQSLRKPESRLTLCTVCTSAKSHQKMLHHDAIVGSWPAVLSGSYLGIRSYKNEACQPSVSICLVSLVTSPKHNHDVQATDFCAKLASFGTCQLQRPLSLLHWLRQDMCSRLQRQRQLLCH